MVNEVLKFLSAHVGEVITGVAALVAILGAVSSRAETRKQRALATEQLRQSIDSASLDWGNAAIDVLGRSAMLARTRHAQPNEAAFRTAKTALLMGLSSLVERGRMFFPNLNENLRGADKEGAYRGHRPPILDALMFAYYELQALTRDGGPTSDNSADYIEDCRRLLVSELQAHLDPRRLNQVLGRYNNQARTHQTDALNRSRNLKAQLISRRPGLRMERVTATQPTTETPQ